MMMGGREKVRMVEDFRRMLRFEIRVWGEGGDEEVLVWGTEGDGEDSGLC